MKCEMLRGEGGRISSKRVAGLVCLLIYLFLVVASWLGWRGYPSPMVLNTLALTGAALLGVGVAEKFAKK